MQAPIFLEEQHGKLGMARGFKKRRRALQGGEKDHFTRREVERNLLVIGDMESSEGSVKMFSCQSLQNPSHGGSFIISYTLSLFLSQSSICLSPE